jgi:hypothetical protein
MVNDQDNLSGRDLQDSQSGGDSGNFAGATNQQADPAGGGATASDRSNSGGSSGTGGYGRSENVVEQRDGQPGQGSQAGLAGNDLRAGGGTSEGQLTPQSRGERFDEQQGGGRGPMFDGSGGVSGDAEEEQSSLDRGPSEGSDFEQEG